MNLKMLSQVKEVSITESSESLVPEKKNAYSCTDRQNGQIAGLLTSVSQINICFQIIVTRIIQRLPKCYVGALNNPKNFRTF